MSFSKTLDDCTVHVISGVDVTDDDLDSCARLFSEHYGIWGERAPPPLKPQERVRMSREKLRAECLTDPSNTVLIMHFIEDEHVGHAFVTKWRYEKDTVAWVTQLVVHRAYRKRYIATGMLGAMKGSAWYSEVTMLGIASSHPAACNSLTRLAHITQIDFELIRRHGREALACSTVRYLKGATLGGALFGEACEDGAIALANTRFYVDHSEPQEALNNYVASGRWRLGPLRDGHEFVLLLRVPDEDRIVRTG